MLIVCDFDETAAAHNAARAVLDRYESPEIDALRARYDSGELSFREYQERVFQATGANVEELSVAAVEAVTLRRGFVDAVEAARQANARFIVASAGLHVYIRPLLTLNGLEDIPVVAVSVTADPATGRIIQYDYPEAESWCRSEWAVCKCRPMREALAAGEEVVFVGDGLRSDSCAAGIATTVFARSRLLEFCRQNGIPALPYEDFLPVAEYIRSRSDISQETTEIT